MIANKAHISMAAPVMRSIQFVITCKAGIQVTDQNCIKIYTFTHLKHTHTTKPGMAIEK